MNKKRGIYIAVLLVLLFLVPPFADAQSPVISSGLAYLKSTQTPEGYWGNAIEIPNNAFLESCIVAESLKYVDAADPSYILAIQWINTATINNFDYLLTQLLTLSHAGQDVSTTRDYVLSARNSDGGWGAGENISSDIKRTGLALQAFNAINYSDNLVLYQAINYLTTNQNSDGGWGFIPGNESNTYVTAVALRALAGYSSKFNINDTITRASAYLLTKQNTDGGFGSSPSNVYETALSITALIESGNGDVVHLQDAISYITSTQLADGSWNDDPYSTALALQAIASARPNLSISSISLSKPMPSAGESITVSATISNTGLGNVSGIIVRFFQGDPSSGGTQIGTDQVIPSLVIGASSQASVAASFTSTGGKTIFVVADPEDAISETSESDNRASIRLWVATGPDLAVYSEDLKPSTYVPTPGTAFTLSYTVRNVGESPTSSFPISLYDGDPAQGGSLLSSENISGISGSDTRTGTFGLTLAANGNHVLYVVADFTNQVSEASKTNNTGSVTVNVGGKLTAADLAITSADIILTPSRPHAGNIIQISATVHNIGADAANDFTAEVFDGLPESGGTLLSSQVLSIAAGGTQIVTSTWTIPSGIHDIVVVLDRTNQIIEMSETNNRATARIMTDMVDIIISAMDLTFNPARPVNGDSVLLSFTAHNTGIKDTGSFNLALYDGDPNTGGTLVQTTPINNIAADSSTTIPYTFTATPWTYRFYAIADAENVVTEMYEDNNMAIRSLTVKSPGEALGPELVPIKIDLTDTTTSAQTLAISGTAHVTFQNKGDDKITTSFNVLIFEDMNEDGRYTAGVDNVLGVNSFVIGLSASIPALWPEGAGMVDIQLSGTVKFLHSPLYAFVDSSDVILEQDEANNAIISCKDCEVVPSNPIQPVLKWTKNMWIDDQPVIMPLIDTNGDGKINDNDIPAIISTGRVSGNDGQLTAIRGDTGATIFSYHDLNHPIYNASFIAGGDIEGDGFPEIVVPRACCIFPGVTGEYPVTHGCGLLVLDHNGNLKWDNIAVVGPANCSPGYDWTGPNATYPVIADLEHSGKPDLIVGWTVFNSSDGSIKWATPLPRGSLSGYVVQIVSSTVADLDLDGEQEVISRNAAYNRDGTVKWWNTSVNSHGVNVVGRFKDDPFPEIVHEVGYNNIGIIHLLDHNGNILWGPVYTNVLDPSNNSSNPVFGVPIIADFDGDGESEIGIRGAAYYFALNKDGAVKHSYFIPGFNWNDTTSAATVFDLNGDGDPEMLIYGNGYFRVFDGKNSTLLYEEYLGINDESLGKQDVLIADVDGDGQVEIVVVNWMQIRVYGSKNHDWVGGRKVWNQYDYHVTNVNDDGTIPTYESPSWILNNTFRNQAAIGMTPNPYLTPNLTASYLRIEQEGPSVNIGVRIGNGGAVASPATVTVTFYDGDPVNGGIAIGTAATTRNLNPGDYQDVIYSWSGGSLGLHHVYAVIDATNAISECRKDDNQINSDFTIQTAYADLKIGQEDITFSDGPYYEGTPVQVNANIKNIGTLPTSNILVRMYNGNPSSGGTQIGADQTIAVLNAGTSISLTFTYDTLGKSGTNILYIVIDPANTITEASKTNNTASVTFTVQPPVLPDLAITSDDIQLTPASPPEGNKLTVIATVHNQGAATSNVAVNIYLGNPASGGALVSSQTIYQVLALGSTTSIQAAIDTTGSAGQQQVYITIDPANMIAESRQDNNSANKSVFIQSAGLTASLTLDKSVYNADDILTATLTAADTTGSIRYLTVDLYAKDSAGNTIATISQVDPVTISPNSSGSITRTWNTGATLAGQYTIVAELTESGRVISRKSTGFTIAQNTHISASITIDKISYNPNESAALSTVITSQSRNVIFQNLTATLTMAGASGQGQGSGPIYTDTKTITTLMPGATFSFKDYWNTGTYPAGTYPLTVQVKDATGAVITSGTQNLVISSIINPSSALKGQITVDKQKLLSGDPVIASYTVTNIGNIDLQNITISILTIHVVDETVRGTITDQASIPISETYTNAHAIDTTGYTAKDYLVILQAAINGTTETIASSYFRVEGAPSSPSLASPGNGTDVLTLTPALSVNNASDPNDDKLTYEFEVYCDSGLSQLVISTGGSSQETEAGTTSWTLPTPLIENRTYTWRARAYDGWLYGPWMTPASFRVNTVDDPPTAPAIASPNNGTSVATFMPVLTVNNSTDPDSTNLTYNFDVAIDPDFTQIVATTEGVAGGQGTTSWQVPQNLNENTTYYWRARADDWFMPGPWSTTVGFVVNTVNDPPTTPVIQSPADNATITASETDITVTNSMDPDSTIITYYFELDTNMTFDSPKIVRSGLVPQGQGTTTWHVTGLQEDTQYYVRVKASDYGQAESAWSSVRFFVNTVNEPPTTPILANPSNGGAVTVFTPTLTVLNATDPDRDALTYDFEVYSDPTLSSLVTSRSGVRSQESGAGTNSWQVPMALTENQTYYWRVRAYDGSLYSPWMPIGSFMVNTADDAPSAPTVSSPADGSSVSTLTPTLVVTNATDPDSPVLTYEFEIYSGGALVANQSGVSSQGSGTTSWTVTTPLIDNTVYTWRARANDGQLSGPWTNTASFTVHIPVTSITATINFDPDTLNKSSNGTWVVVYIELPAGYNVKDIDVTSIRLVGTIPAEPRPYAIGDHDEDGIPDLMVKFKRSDVINALPLGDKVTVHVSGKAGSTTFDGVDVIRVIQ